MSFTLKNWNTLYNATTTTNTSDISEYLDEVFTNLTGGAYPHSTIFADGDNSFRDWFVLHYSGSTGFFPRVVNSSYFRVQQYASSFSTIPDSSKPKTIPTPFSYLLTERYRGTDFYDKDFFQIKTSIDSEIDAALLDEQITDPADKALFKGDLLKEHLQTKGYQTVLWDFFVQWRPTRPNQAAPKKRTFPELLKLYAKTLKDEGYNLKNLGASSNTPTAQAALEILQGSNAAAARATVQRSVNAVPPREYAEGDLQRFFQCALMSDLFIGPSGLPHDTPGSYAALKKLEKGYNKKIYPVGFEQNNGELNPGCFMNKLLYPDGTQEFFQNTEDLYPPDNNPGWYNGRNNNKKHEVISKSIHFIEKIKVNGEFKLHEVELNNIQNLGTNTKAISAINPANLPQLKSLLNQAKAKPSAVANNFITANLQLVDSSITTVTGLEQKLKTLTFSANTGQTTEEIIFDGMTISFNGTNPSTARKDVKVDLKFTLTSLHALTSVVVGSRHDGTDLFLKDLVTVPDTHTSGNPVLKNDYSPDFNRIRIKAKARVGPSGTTNYLPGSDLILDLAVIDHSLERGSENGTVTFSINYRGFFNSAMSMPFMDCLVDSGTTDKRIKRSNEFDDLARHFADRTVPTPNYPVVGAFAPEDSTKPPTEKDLRSFTKESRKLFENEKTAGATSDSFITRLVNKHKIREYTLHKPNMFTNFVNDGFFDYDLALSGQGFVTVKLAASTATDQTVIADVKTNKQADEDKKETTSVTKGYFFYFGDLIDVVTDSIYDKNVPGQLKKEFKHLNLKFLISDIEIYDPVYKKRKVINICQMPIDVSYFAQWFNDVVVGKGLTFFPTSQMIISLAERMIGSLLYDICYGDTFANETPPRIRVGYFQDTRDSTSNDLKTALKDCESATVFRKQFKSGDFNGAPIILRDADFVLSKTKQSTTYCIIYMQSPPFLLPLESGKVNSYRLKGITPQINYGKRFITYNYLSSVSFSKTDQPFLREARYFNNRALSMISNVYDLSFSFKEVGKKASTVLYPATTLEMFLRDWPDPTQWLPHYKDAIAGLLGFGGYFGISSVVYNLGVTDSQWSIDVKTKFLGTDSSAEVPQNNVAPKNIKTPPSDPKGLPPGGPFLPASSTTGNGAGGDDSDEDTSQSAELVANGTSGGKAPATLDPDKLPVGAKLLMPGRILYNGANYMLKETVEADGSTTKVYEKQ